MKWDDDVDTSHQNRVSPWEIEPTCALSGPTGLSASGSKRTKICLPSRNPDCPVPSKSAATLLLGYIELTSVHLSNHTFDALNLILKSVL